MKEKVMGDPALRKEPLMGVEMGVETGEAVEGNSCESLQAGDGRSNRTQ